MKTAIQLVASDILDIKTLNIDEVREIVKILTLRMDDEKQQIIEAHRKGHVNGFLEICDNEPEKYYNETFKP